jgi:hypothetical protein
MKRKLSEREAWVEVAEIVGRDTWRWGVCEALNDLYVNDQITLHTADAMSKRIDRLPDADGESYKWSRDKDGRRLRVAWVKRQIKLLTRKAR